MCTATAEIRNPVEHSSSETTLPPSENISTVSKRSFRFEPRLQNKQFTPRTFRGSRIKSCVVAFKAEV
ncbi:hypothetical protein CDAR_536651 [Caerostris darwini]|uniref:Uncharacterized protein n=1 Tax=Caerostris darwini TaxID=1538125 RepID=A0AAV4VJ64_9ARAC|nr:hypothetical protein CDAR_536651 [Caerostris darwini]